MSQLTRSLAGAALILLAGCAGPVRDAIPVSGNQEFTLRPGERATLPGPSSLRYIGVANDSRCPPTVKCVWAGDAEVTLSFEQAGKTTEIVLHTANPAPQPLGAWSLTLVGLERGAAPAATLRLEDSAGGGG